MKKHISFEHTVTRQELEQILTEYLEKKLEKEDIDFRDQKYLHTDFTFRFTDGNPEVDVFFFVDFAKFRQK